MLLFHYKHTLLLFYVDMLLVVTYSIVRISVVTLDPPSLLLNGEKKYKKALIKEGVVSSVIKHNLNPSWGDETLKVNIASIDIEGLYKCCNIVIALWDEDKMSANDLIGVTYLPFQEIVDYYRSSDHNKGG